MRTRTMIRLLKKIPPVVAAYYPLVGCTCVFCGFVDKRHRMFDALAGRVRAGDSVRSVADDFGIPLPVVRAVAKWWREGK